MRVDWCVSSWFRIKMKNGTGAHWHQHRGYTTGAASKRLLRKKNGLECASVFVRRKKNFVPQGE